jgi:DNA replication protein DnaC
MSAAIEKVTLNCPKHGDYLGKTDRVNLWGRGFDITTMCPVCEKEQKTKEEREEVERIKYSEIQAMRNMNIDELFYESGFDNFKAYNAELREHLETCKTFAENPKGKLVMVGENGNGKNHLAISILKKVGGVIYTAYEIGMMLRDCYNGNGNETDTFDHLCSVPLLVIDEVEKLKDSEAKKNWMSQVVGKRYNRMLPIVLIANGHVQSDCREKEKPCPKCLEYHLENDILSRIIEDGKILKFNSEDYRYKKRENSEGL